MMFFLGGEGSHEKTKKNKNTIHMAVNHTCIFWIYNRLTHLISSQT